MKAHSEKHFSFGNVLRPLAIGAAVGIVVCVLVLLAMAALMASGLFPSPLVTPLALIAAAIGALAAGFTAARLSRERGLLYGAGSGLLLFLLTAVAGFAMLPDAGGTWLAVKAALTVGAGALGGVIGVNIKRR